MSFSKNMKIEIKVTEQSVIFTFKQRGLMKNPNNLCALGHCQGVNTLSEGKLHRKVFLA